MADITNIAITATTPATAEYMYDLLIAARAAQLQGPLKFPFARRITFRTPGTNIGAVYLTKDPKSTAEGEALLPDLSIDKECGGPHNGETVRNWYVWAETAGNELEITQEY